METPEQSTKSAQKNNEYSLLTHCLFIVNFEQISNSKNVQTNILLQ